MSRQANCRSKSWDKLQDILLWASWGWQLTCLEIRPSCQQRNSSNIRFLNLSYVSVSMPKRRLLQMIPQPSWTLSSPALSQFLAIHSSLWEYTSEYVITKGRNAVGVKQRHHLYFWDWKKYFLQPLAVTVCQSSLFLKSSPYAFSFLSHFLRHFWTLQKSAWKYRLSFQAITDIYKFSFMST